MLRQIDPVESEQKERRINRELKKLGAAQVMRPLKVSGTGGAPDIARRPRHCAHPKVPLIPQAAGGGVCRVLETCRAVRMVWGCVGVMVSLP